MTSALSALRTVCRRWSRSALTAVLFYVNFCGCLPGLRAAATPANAQADAAQADHSQTDHSQADESQNSFKLQIQSNLVVVRVVVQDAQGHPVAGLRQEDFKLQDNGKEQSIAQFAVETGASSNAITSTSVSSQPATAEHFLALYFDDLNLTPDEIRQSRDAADHYLSSSLASSVRVGIFTSSAQIEADFSSDRSKLHEALFKLRSNSKLGTDCPALSDYQAKLIVEQTSPPAFRGVTPSATPSPDTDALAAALDDAKNNCHMTGVNGRVIFMKAQQILGQALWQAQYSLQALKDVVNHISDMPGQRNVIFFSPGFLTDELGSRISAIADSALRSQVVIGSIDAKGLAMLLPEADIRTSYATVDSHLLAVKRDMAHTREQMALSVLEEVAADTGGRFIHNDNDLEAGMRSAATLSEVSYILAFAPSNLKQDGRFHSIKVALREKRKGVALQARRGYFAPLAGAKPPDEMAEAIRSAILSREDLHALPLDLTTEISRGTGEDSGKAELGIMARVEVGRVHFRKDGEHNLNALIFVCSVFDHDGLWVGGQQKKLALDLPDEQLQQLMNSPGVLMRSAFHLEPGTYSIREVVMDSEDHHIGAITRSIEVPEFNNKPASHPAQ